MPVSPGSSASRAKAVSSSRWFGHGLGIRGGEVDDLGAAVAAAEDERLALPDPARQGVRAPPMVDGIDRLDLGSRDEVRLDSLRFLRAVGLVPDLRLVECHLRALRLAVGLALGGEPVELVGRRGGSDLLEPKLQLLGER